MGILGFLFGLGCLVVIAGVIAFVGHVVFGRKPRQQNRPPHPPSPKPAEQRRFGSSQSTPLLTPVLPGRVIYSGSRQSQVGFARLAVGISSIFDLPILYLSACAMPAAVENATIALLLLNYRRRSRERHTESKDEAKPCSFLYHFLNSTSAASTWAF